MMKKSFILITVLFFVAKPIYSQDFWEVLETPPGIGVLSVDINSNNDIFMGIAFSAGGGVLRKLNNGNGWDTSLYLNNDVIGKIYIDQSDNVFAASTKIYYSDNNGNNWNLIFPGQIFGITSIFENSSDNIFFGTWGGVYKTDSIGSEWVRVLSLENWEAVNTIIEDTINLDLFAGTTNYFNGGGIYRSIDGGDNWEHFGLTDHYVSSLALNSLGDLFAGTRGHYSLGTGGVFRLPHGQTEWENLNNEEFVTSLVINSEDNIFIGCSTLDAYWGGVRRSMDNGLSWEDISLETMYDRDITTMVLDPQEHLYACVHNSPTPLYKSVNPTITSIPELQADKRIMTYNFPNPFSGSTQIWYSINRESDIRFCIYNHTGQHVKTIYAGIQPAGNHSVVFDAAAFENGVYFYSIFVNGERTDSGKMTVVK